ncbi:MAG: GNAT family N-acetyltransferase [Fimbriimonadaceae bacterium]|nr:GNAT family N-acetyltransferase [Fimbriimonadaceae bacterium]
MNVVPVTLQTPHLDLSPMVQEDAEALRATVDDHTFDFYMGHMPADTTPQAFASFIAATLADPSFVSFVARLRDTGEVVAKSSYLDLRPAHRSLEIGATWIAPAWQGTFVNPEMKLAMMRHAFETLGCVRVQLKTDMRNLQSRAAILKAGAVFEGTLRKHGVQPNGYVRDTAMYSVTDEEWPGVRAMLEGRVAAWSGRSSGPSKGASLQP